MEKRDALEIHAGFDGVLAQGLRHVVQKLVNILVFFRRSVSGAAEIRNAGDLHLGQSAVVGATRNAAHTDAGGQIWIVGVGLQEESVHIVVAKAELVG